jgi:DnaA family protein
LYLQRRFRRDLPTLWGLLDAIDSAALQAQRRLTVPFIREVLGSSSPASE